jgi:hypothetical protein
MIIMAFLLHIALSWLDELACYSQQATFAAPSSNTCITSYLPAAMLN